ncbi:unnamed protein product, partial [Cylicocyclus nassatus]
MTSVAPFLNLLLVLYGSKKVTCRAGTYWLRGNECDMHGIEILRYATGVLFFALAVYHPYPYGAYDLSTNSPCISALCIHGLRVYHIYTHFYGSWNLSNSCS